jgi:hypothetical protein
MGVSDVWKMVLPLNDFAKNMTPINREEKREK